MRILSAIVLLVSFGATSGELTQYEQDLFHDYINKRNLTKLEELLKKDSAYLQARSGKPDVLPLQGAVRKSFHEGVTLFLKFGADVNEKGGIGITPLREAVAASDNAMIKLLLDKGADPMAREDAGSSAFDDAVGRGNMEAFQWMLETGKVRLNEHNPREGATPLINAVRAGRNEMIEILIERGAEVERAMPGSQHTALFFAAIAPANRPQRFKCIDLLLKRKANLQTVDKSGQCIFHSSLREGNREMYDFLLSKDPTFLNRQDHTGNTPFISACAMGFKDTVEYLIAKAADTTVKNKNGSTGYTAAKPEIKKLLKEKYEIKR